MKLNIYCDGASSNNQEPKLRVGGYGVVAFVKTADGVTLTREIGGQVKGATNNNMELRAIEEGLKSISLNDRPKTEAYVESDSAYSINIFTKWIEGWKAKGWKKKKGAIENLELIKEIDSLAGDYKSIRFVHVPRCSNQWITRADEIASKHAGSR